MPMRHTIVIARSRADLDRAPMFALIRADLRLYPRLSKSQWSLFSVDTGADDDVLDHAERLGLPAVAGVVPMRDDEEAPERATDEDAALTYLATDRRNTLVKLPDDPSSEFYRLYVTEDGAERWSGPS
jgi:hypothetical protein